MARTRSRRGARPGRSGRNKSPVGAIELFTRPQQHIAWRVLGFLVRARAELFIATTLVVVSIQLQAWVTPMLDDIGTPQHAASITIAIMLGTSTVLLVIPASRRFLVRRMWCVTTRHRMRACFVQSRTMTLDGRLPFLLWSRPSPVGERVRVWLPAGLSVKDIEDDAQKLAAACWAHEARVTPTRHQAALVVVDIVRRDPLGTTTVLEPTVLDTIDDEPDTGDATVVPLPDRTALPASAPADFPTVQATCNGSNGDGAKPRHTRKTPATTPAGDNDTSEPAVTGFGGVDVSDYV
jgi:hypothetical protein